LGWSTVLGLVTVPIVVMFLGMDHFGLYGLFAVLLAPLSLANLGFGDATIKYVAEYAHKGDYQTCGRFIRTTLLFNSVMGLACGAAMAFVGPTLAVKFFHIAAPDRHLVAECLVLVGATWALNQIGAVFMAVPPAVQSFKTVAVCQVLISSFLALASIGAVWAGLGLYGYTAASLATAGFGVAVGYLASKRLIPSESFLPRMDRNAWRRSLDFGVWRAAAQMGGLLGSQSERFLLGVFLTPQAVGFYNLAANLEGRAYTVVFKMSEVLFPLFSSIQSESKVRQFSLLLRATWLLTTLSVCALAPMMGLAEPLLTAWIGGQAGQQAALPLQLMAVAGMLGCATNASYFLLLGVGKTKWTALLSVATGLTTVGVAAWVLPRFGLRGAAVGAIFAMLVQQALLGALVLPRIFGAAFGAGRFLLAFYTPVAVGLAFAFGIMPLTLFSKLRLVPLLGLYALVSILCGIVIVACHWRPSKQSVHFEDVVRLLVFFRHALELGGKR
jgi:O-antigen/teichoic acid export membrane protein